jgi:hypothetical protein
MRPDRFLGLNAARRARKKLPAKPQIKIALGAKTILPANFLKHFLPLAGGQLACDRLAQAEAPVRRFPEAAAFGGIKAAPQL